MANNYVQFSFAISVTEEQKAWFLELGEYIDYMSTEPDDDEDAPEFVHLTDDDMKWAADMIQGSAPGLIIEEVSHVDLPAIVIHSDESGDVDVAAQIAQRFLQQHHTKNHIIFSYALLSSQPRINEFGGGAVYVCAQEIANTTTDDLIQTYLKNYSTDGSANYPQDDG